MLTYLINVTEDLLFTSIAVGVIFAFIDHFGTRTAKTIIRIGLIFGIVAAGVRAYITNTIRLVGGWRVGMYGHIAAIAAFILLVIVLIIFGRPFRRGEGKKKKTADIIVGVFAGLLIAAYMFSSIHTVLAYPFKFDTGGNGVLSSDFLLRLGGYIAALIICIVSAVCAYKILTVAARKGYVKLLTVPFWIIVALYAVGSFLNLMLVLTPRKIIDSMTMFNIAAFSSNHSQWYTYAAFVIMLIVAVIVWVKSYTAKEPYDTNAQHRKQKALWRTGKRYSIALIVCFVLGILCATWFVELNTVVIREAPVEEPILVKDSDGNDLELQVPLEMVLDGHLHRFGYTTDDGNPTRFIVVLKQENTTNFGVGLDACDICGEAGYYENNEGQVVCKKCNVVMNKTTIGMKGGCNPIIIDYDITDGYITVPVEEMVKNQSRFKK